MSNRNLIIVVSIMIFGAVFYSIFSSGSPKPEVLDMEMIAMLKDLYGEDLVRKEFGEAVLEECKKIEFFPDSEMRKYFPYDYEDENGFVSEEMRKQFEIDQAKGLAVMDGNYKYKTGRFANRKD
jgi:hypothetical protein